jgi:hypothetical protein
MFADFRRGWALVRQQMTWLDLYTFAAGSMLWLIFLLVVMAVAP